MNLLNKQSLKIYLTLHVCIILVFVSLNTQAQTPEEWTAKAETAVADGDYKEAIIFYTKAIELKPDLANAYFRRGFAYTIQKDYQNAIADYTTVIESRPDFIWAYISRGSAYNKLNKFTEGLSDFNKAIAMDPKNQEAYNNRGWSKKGLGNDQSACDDWKQSKKLGNEEAKLILKTSGCK